MAVGITENLGGAPVPEPGFVPAVSAPRRGRRLQLPRSPKILAGLGMLAFFLLIAVIGPTIAPDNPSASSSPTGSVPLPPSAAHWMGTTQLQQDVFSQFLAGGRSTVLVAFVAGLAATVLSVLIGVTAGYVGGGTDDLLSMLANFFLVMPALPLLIVIFGFLPASSGGSDDPLIGLIIALTGWAWGGRRSYRRVALIRPPGAPAQPGESCRDRGCACRPARLAAGRRVRHRVPSDDAAPCLSLRSTRGVVCAARGATIRVPWP